MSGMMQWGFCFLSYTCSCRGWCTADQQHVGLRPCWVQSPSREQSRNLLRYIEQLHIRIIQLCCMPSCVAPLQSSQLALQYMCAQQAFSATRRSRHASVCLLLQLLQHKQLCLAVKCAQPAQCTAVYTCKVTPVTVTPVQCCNCQLNSISHLSPGLPHNFPCSLFFLHRPLLVLCWDQPMAVSRTSCCRTTA